MKKITKTTKKISTGKKVAIGAGVAALAVGAYFLFGPDGKKNQKKLKGWMGDMKDEIIKKLEAAKEVTQPMYEEVVDTVAGKYAAMGGMDKKEILALAKTLKKNWKSMMGAMKGGKDTAKSTAKTAKKTVQKVAKKAVKVQKALKN